jgi:T5SS/PEP-CTERM-associated repeat protein
MQTSLGAGFVPSTARSKVLRRNHTYQNSGRPSLKRFDSHLQVTTVLLGCIQPGGIEMRAHLLTTTAVMALLSASTLSTRAQTTNWIGVTSDWFTAGNWTAGVPTSGTSAIVGNLNNPAVVGTPNAAAQSLAVGGSAPGEGGRLIILNGGTLFTSTGGVVGGQFTTGDATVTGPFSVWSNTVGGIQVGGGFGISTLTVANGGFVFGSFFGGLITVGGGTGFGVLRGDGGDVTSTQISAGGVLAPGQGGTPGAMNVLGNLAFLSGAFYIVQVNPTTASTTNVSGTASLAGTVVANFAPGSYVSRSYTILTATGGVAARSMRSPPWACRPASKPA